MLQVRCCAAIPHLRLAAESAKNRVILNNSYPVTSCNRSHMSLWQSIQSKCLNGPCMGPRWIWCRSTACAYWTALIDLDSNLYPCLSLLLLVIPNVTKVPGAETLGTSPKQRAVAFLHRGQCHRNLARPDEAEADYARCLELDPNCNEVISNFKNQCYDLLLVGKTKLGILAGFHR